jgi:hypothetical protein
MGQVSAPGGLVPKAWVIFNGTTGDIISSFNVASVTRTAVGSYTVNFLNALPSADYVSVFGGGGSASNLCVTTGGQVRTTTQCAMGSFLYNSGTANDHPFETAVFF